jgi:hypothetical protein
MAATVEIKSHCPSKIAIPLYYLFRFIRDSIKDHWQIVLHLNRSCNFS